MNIATDAKTQVLLVRLGLRTDVPLTKEQELTLQLALDPEQQYQHDVEQLFTTQPSHQN